MSQLVNNVGGGSGTVTSVALSATDGLQIDSGSPITSAGTITLGVDKTALLAHINVEDGAQVNDPTTLLSADIGVTVQSYDADATTRSIIYIIDGGGSVITTGIKGDVVIPFDCTISEVTMLADQTGSIVVDVWKDSYANFPPTDADSITASAVPTITTSTKSQDVTLTGWTTSIASGSTLRFNVDSVTDIQRVTVALKVTI